MVKLQKSNLLVKLASPKSLRIVSLTMRLIVNFISAVDSISWF